MHLDDLPPEIILAVFQCCTSISDVTRLSQSCRRIHGMLSAPQRTLVLYHAAEVEFGPVHDILQLLTLNNSQPAWSIRDPPRSDSLLRQILMVGQVARRWEEIYPLSKWDSDFANRRFLSRNERYRLRRAIYRYWLYTHAFHNPTYPRTTRRIPRLLLERAKLLRNWSTKELAEIDDFQASMRTLISTKICPSDATVHMMLLGTGGCLPTYTAKQPLTHAAQDFFHTSRDACHVVIEDPYQMAGLRGWGDPVTHYYIIEDLLKLDPKAVMWLHDHPQKWQVEEYLHSLGEWFGNNGDTFSETLACVLEGQEGGVAGGGRDLCCGIIEEFSAI